MMTQSNFTSIENQVTPKGYKKTELGIIPEDWTLKSFEKITSKIGDGIHSTPIYSSTGEYYFINGNNLVAGKVHIDGETKKIASKEFRKYKQSLGGKTILLSINGTIGNRAFYNAEPVLLGKSAAFLNINSEFNLQYVYYVLGSKRTLDQFNDGLTGSTIKNLGLGTIRNTLIPVPILPEQEKIATALSDTDALISELEKLIKKKQAIKTATMQQLLTGKTRLPEFALREDGTPKAYKESELGQIPEDWGVDKIGNTLSITTGSRNTQDKVNDGTYPFFVRSQNIERINTYSFDGEGVLTAGDGVGTGKIFHYINGKCDIHQRVYLMSNFKQTLDGYYFYIFFSNYFYDRIMSMTAKSSVDSVRREMIADMLIFLPSIKEQKKIASVIKNLFEEIEVLNIKLNKLLKIKQGMMQELLTGKTRLV